ncbi:MAG: hypothetical protein AAGI45_22300 [Cyanobacteria bacterium P01_H01_bin.26]
MSEALQATLKRIAEQQEANTAANSALAERQAELAERQGQTDSASSRLLQMTERLAPQVIENTERINSLSANP